MDHGNARHQGQKRRPNWWLAPVFYVSVILAAAAVSTWNFSYEVNYLMFQLGNTEIATARVVRHEHYTTHSADNFWTYHHHILVYKFQPSRGPEQRSSDFVTLSLYRRYPVGSSMRVRYSVSSPALSELVDANRLSDRAWKFAGLVTLNIIAVLGFAFFRPMMRRFQKYSYVPDWEGWER